MLLAYSVYNIVANTCEYSTVLSRMKGSFSVDIENTLTEIRHERNGSLMIGRWFCFFSRSRISVTLTPLSGSVLFVTEDT